MMQDATKAYETAKEIGRICRESKTLKEAQEKVRAIQQAREVSLTQENLDAVVASVGHWLK